MCVCVVYVGMFGVCVYRCVYIGVFIFCCLRPFEYLCVVFFVVYVRRCV